jgi:hypothetical protein
MLAAGRFQVLRMVVLGWCLPCLAMSTCVLLKYICLAYARIR